MAAKKQHSRIVDMTARISRFTGGLASRLIALTVVVLFSIASPAEAMSDPADIVRATTEEILTRVEADRAHLEEDQAALFALVDEIVLPNFDFERMSRWVLGKYWRQATPDERVQFVREFKRLLVRTYANALFNYNGEELKVQPVASSDDAKTVTVRTELVRSGSGSIPVFYKMHSRDGRWKVFDVMVDGVSMVSTYRSSFATEVQRGGVSGLIDTLLAKNAE